MRAIYALVTLCCIAVASSANAQTIRLVYPVQATTVSKVDETKTLNKAKLPVEEEEETDVETPIGQVRSVLDSLRAIRESQDQQLSKLTELLDNPQASVNLEPLIADVKPLKEITSKLQESLTSLTETVDNRLSELQSKASNPFGYKTLYALIVCIFALNILRMVKTSITTIVAVCKALAQAENKDSK